METLDEDTQPFGMFEVDFLKMKLKRLVGTRVIWVITNPPPPLSILQNGKCDEPDQ